MNTMQQEFDAVVAHLYSQGKPARTGDMCMYRAGQEAGKVLMCAVGCRIPDSKYVPEMDTSGGSFGTGVNMLISRFGWFLPEEITTYRDMFSDLQSAHDDYMHADGAWHYPTLAVALAEIAENYGLTFTEPARG